MNLQEQVRERLAAMAMEGSVKASPEARRLINSVDDEVDYLAEHTLAVARAIAEGSTGEHDVRVSITTRFVVPDEGDVDILAVETEVDAEGARFWLSLE